MIPCKFVHDTGSMIRFRTSQIGLLPAASGDIQLLLPTGRLVSSHFNRHPQNPNVSGRDLVRYIKRRLEFGDREDVLVERRTANLWVVHLLAQAMSVAREARVPVGKIRGGMLQPPDLAALVAIADRENDRGRRVGVYKRVLRPTSLRRLVVGAVGASCMVEECDACEGFDTDWGAGSGAVIVELHHIEQVARTIDHHPRNLCILCANHHRFLHGSGVWSIRHVGSDVVLARATRELVIRRPAEYFPAA